MSVRALMRSFEMSQRAQARSPYTVRLYRDCLHRFVAYLESETGVDAVSGLSRRLLTDYVAYRASIVAPATVWTDFKVLRVFVKRAQAAGVVGFHPHRLRHDYAHRWLVAGGAEGDLMENAGWSSIAMLRRYGRSAASNRAQAASRRLALAEVY